MKFYIRLIFVVASIYILTELFGGLGFFLFLFAVGGYILYNTKN